MLNIVFRQIEHFVARKSQLLTPFQEFVLMKPKLNMPLEDLAYRFNVSFSTISRVFLAWTVAMDTRQSSLIKWCTMPQCFQFSFRKKTTVIIDCFQVFLEPSCASTNFFIIQTSQHYQVLIGITLQGTISFVSKAWGRRSSDKFLTENCGSMEKLNLSMLKRQGQLQMCAFTSNKLLAFFKENTLS